MTHQPLQTKGRFKEACPRKISNPPSSAQPCPVAMEALEKLEQGDKEGAALCCPWMVRDANAGLCWWSQLNREIDLTEPLTFKEIGKLISEPESEIKAAYESGVEKMRLNTNNEGVRELIEELVNATRTAVDPDIYEAERMEVADIEDESANIIRGFSEGLVVHKGGKKIQLYGLSRSHSKLMKEYNEAHPEARATFSENTLHKVEKVKPPKKLKKPKFVK